MKVLFVCHRVPFPPKRGGKIRPFNIIRHLHEQGHEVTVASLARSQAEADEAEGLAQHCSRRLVEIVDDRLAWPRMVAWLPTTRPRASGTSIRRGCKARIDAELATGAYDLVFVHCSSVAPYVADAPATVKILDFGDMDSQKWREYSQHKPFPLSAGYWLEAVKLERTERLLAGQFDLATCTTRAEMESLRALGVTGPTDWFPNGVDAGFFQPAGAALRAGPRHLRRPHGLLPEPAGRDEVLRRGAAGAAARRPGTRFEIVGADPSPEIRELGKLPGVTVTGSVPDVRPYVTRAALTVAPLEIARGTQNKILESMAMGVPVVCSRQAVRRRGRRARASTCSPTTRREQLIEAILQVLESRELRERLAAAGRARVLSHHSWPTSMQRLDALIASQFAEAGRSVDSRCPT